MTSESNAAALAKALTERQFGEFFVYPMHDQTIEKIWRDSSRGQLLDDLLNDPRVSDESKFLACEVFFKKDILFMQRHSPETVADIYTQALRNNLTGMANSWGLLYEQQDEGPVGIAFLTIGAKAIPSLAKLLGDESTHLKYQGSMEATLGNGYGYRIKDFAAYYIGRIMGTTLKYYPKVVDRDRQISDLKEQLGALKIRS